ncbi:YolD-like family protein [Paenibacillus cremeus]|uniref:YolD-like family protein n=1 Tax=Paenibacillus cremeus TaxID=2163881 RepID=A0A559KDZ7_9BACL|nr:YolD-like family protein [Paenibacillus cremeus]
MTEEEQQELFGRLKASLRNSVEVTITVFGELGNRQVTGGVAGLDPKHRLVKVETSGDWELIEFENVLAVELSSVEY